MQTETDKADQAEQDSQAQRRKTAANAFASLMDIPKERTYSALESLGLPKTARIESLDMEQLIALSRKLKNI